MRVLSHSLWARWIIFRSRALQGQRAHKHCEQSTRIGCESEIGRSVKYGRVAVSGESWYSPMFAIRTTGQRESAVCKCLLHLRTDLWVVELWQALARQGARHNEA